MPPGVLSDVHPVIVFDPLTADIAIIFFQFFKERLHEIFYLSFVGHYQPFMCKNTRSGY
jgi:hypothetical protein